MAETPGKETQGDKQPEAVQQRASSRLTATLVSLAALAIIGAATANSLPNFDRFALPNFDRFSFPKLDRSSFPKFDHVSFPKFDYFSLPNFNRTSSPNSNRVTAQSPQKTAPAPIPDPIVSAALKDIQLSQQQNATVLVSLTQNSAAQQADLKRISRQLSSLAVQVEAVHGAVTPLTTSSIPHSNARARVIRTSRKTVPALPKPVGPVSVGGAPLNPAPAAGSRAS